MDSMMAIQDFLPNPKSNKSKSEQEPTYFGVAICNVRELRPNMEDVVKQLSQKCVMICAYQKTKTDEVILPENEYSRVSSVQNRI